MARREEGACCRYVTEEQRRRPGCLGREIDRLSHSRALSRRARRLQWGTAVSRFARPAPTSVPIHDLLAARCSSHAFDPELPVARDDQLALFEAARWAPSFQNQQPWRFVVCDRFADPAAWQKAFELVPSRARPWAHNAALILLVCAELAGLDGREAGPLSRAVYDTGAAALQLCLEATARNLAINATHAIDEPRLRSAFAIPESCACLAMLCIGHRADAGTLGRDVYLREMAARRREPLAERFFGGSFGVTGV